MVWASTSHFYVKHPTFYNFPYTFGYLFSLGLLAQRQKFQDFYQRYEALLRDSASMNVEDLARKHFDLDIGGKEFWQHSLKVVAGIIGRFRRD